MKRKIIAILTMACMLCTMSVPAFGAEKTETAAMPASSKMKQQRAETKAYQECDQTLETEELVESQIDMWGNILNANHVLWKNEGNIYGGYANYTKKTGIQKAYSRVYLDTKGMASFQNKAGETKTRQGVKDIGGHSLLQKDGTLVDLDTNQVIDTQVKTWYESGGGRSDLDLLVKDNGNVYTFTEGKVGSKVSGVENVAEISEYYDFYKPTLILLTEKGELYKLKYEWDDNYNRVLRSPVLLNNNVKNVVKISSDGNAMCYVKDGKTYSFDDQPIFEKEAVDCYSQGNDEFFVTAGKELYQRSYNSTNEGYDTVKVADGFKRFTEQGYELENGTYYNWEGQETDLISVYEDRKYNADGTYELLATLQLKTDQCLYLNGTKLLSHVTNYRWGSPLIITRTDGTVWLYDTGYYELSSRERLDPPQKLTEALAASIYVRDNPPQKSNNGTTTPPASKAKSPNKPKKATLKKASSPKKGTLKLTWKRDKTVTGYQAMIAKDKKFKKGKKTALIKKNKTVTKTFKKLKRKKTYYAKVRAYKQVGNKKVYGAYSKVKKARVK